MPTTKAKADRTCHRCGLNCKFPSNLKIHLQKKIPCVSKVVPVVAAAEPGVAAPEQLTNTSCICQYCSKSFSTKSNMTRHQRVCPVLVGNGGRPPVVSRELEELRKRLEELSQEVSNNKVLFVTPHITQNNTVTVNITHFWVDSEPMFKIINSDFETVYDANPGFQSIIQEEWTDQPKYAAELLAYICKSKLKHPESRNIKLLSRADQSFLVYTKENQWELRTKHAVVDALMDCLIDSIFRLQQHIRGLWRIVYGQLVIAGHTANNHRLVVGNLLITQLIEILDRFTREA